MYSRLVKPTGGRSTASSDKADMRSTHLLPRGDALIRIVSLIQLLIEHSTVHASGPLSNYSDQPATDRSTTITWLAAGCVAASTNVQIGGSQSSLFWRPFGPHFARQTAHSVSIFHSCPRSRVRCSVRLKCQYISNSTTGMFFG